MAELSLRPSDTTKIALQASRQESKREPLSPKTTKKNSKEPQLKKLQKIVWNDILFAKKTRPETHSTALKENSKTIIERK